MSRRMMIISGVLAFIGVALIAWGLWISMKPTAVTVVVPSAPMMPASVVKQMASLEKRVAKLEKRVIVKTAPTPEVASAPTASASPAPCCNTCCTSMAPPAAPAPVVLAPTAPAPAVLLGQPQTYYNSWGWWLVDPNGSFHCPPVANPTSWTGGMKVLVQRSGSPPYEAWAPACYR